MNIQRFNLPIQSLVFLFCVSCVTNFPTKKQRSQFAAHNKQCFNSLNLAHENANKPIHKPLDGSKIDGSKGLEAEEILKVIRENLGQIKCCYESFLQINPDSSGRIKVLFIVNLDGSVKNVSTKENTVSQSKIMENCISKRMLEWKFPKPRGNIPVTVTYPFEFNPI